MRAYHDTRVIEHSVAIDPGIRYTGELARGITVVNEMRRRGRATGCDLFVRARELVPPTVGTVTAISPRRTRLEVGAGSEWLLAVHLAMLPVDFTLEGPASLRATLEEAGRRLLAAAL